MILGYLGEPGSTKSDVFFLNKKADCKVYFNVHIWGHFLEIGRWNIGGIGINPTVFFSVSLHCTTLENDPEIGFPRNGNGMERMQ